MPVWREVLADLETPVSAFVKLVGDGEGFLLESVEHGERWGRFSFIGRDPALTLVVRGRSGRGRRGAAARGVPPDQGALAALEALLTKYRGAAAGRPPAVPRRHRRVPRLRRRARGRAPARRPRRPDRLARRGARRSPATSPRSTTSASACYLIENVFPAPGVRPRPTSTRRTPARSARLDDLVDELGAPAAVRAVAAPRRPSDRAAAVHAPRWARRSTTGRSRRRRSTSSPATSSRSCSPSASTSTATRPVRRVPGAAPGQPVAVHVLPAPRRGDARRVVAGADGAGARRPGHQPPDRRHPLPGHDRGARPAPGRRADRGPEGAGRARHARRPRPQRRRPGGALRHRAGRRADDARALLARDAPHEPGLGRAGRRQERGRRAARHLPGGHRERRAEGAGDGDHRRAGAGEAGAVRRGGRLPRLLGQPRHRDHHPHDGLARRPGERAGGRGDRGRLRSRARRDLECHNKARALLTAAAASKRLRSLGPQESRA